MAGNKQFEYDESDFEETALPAAIHVKTEILSVRSSAINSMGKVIFNKLYNKNTSREMSEFQSNVLALYFILREKFDKKDDIRKTLDETISNENKMVFKDLYVALCSLNQKIEDMGITRIEIKRLPEEEVF